MVKLKRNYLTYEEIKYIVDDILQDYDTRFVSLIKYVYVAQMLIIDKKFTEYIDNIKDNENKAEVIINIYNKLLENSYIKELDKVENITEIDRIIKESTSSEVILSKFLNNLEKKIDEFNSEETMKSFAVLLNEIAETKSEIDKKIKE